MVTLKNISTIVALLTCSALNVFSQIVDVESPTQGVIFPRVATTANVATPSEGMVVYQTSVPKGLYYYNGTSWSALGGSAGSSTLTFFGRSFSGGPGSLNYSFFSSGFVGSESIGNHHMPRAGKLTNLSIKPLTVIASGAQITLTVRLNGADTNLQLGFNNADGLTLKEDMDEVVVNKGDLVTIKCEETTGMPTGGNNYYTIWLELQ